MKSLHVMRAYAIGKLCIGREEKKKKKGRHNYFCGSPTAHTAQITHRNSLPRVR